MALERVDGRAYDELRPVVITTGTMVHAEGSALIEAGLTRVICTASIEDRVPPFMKGSGKGWVTAEYGMLPRSTPVRNIREAAKGKLGGRTQEIQRLIGRSLRAVIDLESLGEKTIWVDCDVLQADGGTRTASVTGAFVAVAQALHLLKQRGDLNRFPVLDFLAATSVGILSGNLALDLCFAEDSGADVDMNVIQTGSGRLVEIQATAEGKAFRREELDELLTLASKGITSLVDLQRKALGAIGESIGAAALAGS